MVNFREFAVLEKVRLGDNRVILAQGTGSVWVKVKVEGKWEPVELAEVLFVPDLSVVFKEDKCLILNRDGETFGLGRKDRKLFILDCLPMDAYMKNNDYKQCQAVSCLCVKRVGAEFIIIALYVDDTLLACSSK